ncbi:MAG: DUF6701 domain-containing protein, partial [Natronospirillum sp.]
AVLLNHFALATFVEEAASTEVLHHINITHPSKNLTCEPATIELKACADESCTELFEDEAVTLTLAPASGWTGGNTVSFTGETTLLLTRTAEIDITLGASAINPEPDSSPQVSCVGTDGSDCILSFVDTALLLTDDEGDRVDLQTQVAGLAFTPNDLYLSAVETNLETGACQTAIEGADQTVRWAAETVNPASPNGSSVLFNGAPMTTLSGAAPLTFTEFDLSFNNQGRTGAFTLRYDDVGRIRLEAETDLEVEGNTKTLTLINGGPFVVRPSSLSISDITCGGTMVNEEPEELEAFCRAGEDFTGILQALNGQGDVTPNFGNESDNFNLTISSELVAPVGGDDPALSGDTLINNQSFENGEVPLSALEWQWSEVGVNKLQVTMENYFNWSDVDDPITGESTNIGRFVPYNITYELVEAPQLKAAQGEFTYQGQPFSVDLEFDFDGPIIDVTGLNLTGQRTVNYAGEYFRSPMSVQSTAMPNICAESGDENCMTTAASLALLNGSLTLTERNTGLDAGKSFSGQLTWDIDNPPQWQFTRINAADLSDNDDEGEKPLALEWVVSRNDLQDTEVCDDDNCLAGENIEAILEDGDLVYGRIRLRATQAPESRPADMPVVAEFWNGERFAIFEQETGTEQTSFFASSAGFYDFFTLDDVSGDISDSDLETFDWSGFVNGEGKLTLAGSTINEGPGETGRLQVIGNGTQFPPYLLFDWQGTSVDVGPRAIASFGTYEGRPPVLFMLPQGR